MNFATPVGLNWNEQRAGSATTTTLFLACAAASAGLARFGQRVEQREVRQRGEQAAGHDDRLAADLVGQRAEHDEERRADQQRKRRSAGWRWRHRPSARCVRKNSA